MAGIVTAMLAVGGGVGSGLHRLSAEEKPAAPAQAQEGVVVEAAHVAAEIPRGLILEVGCRGQGDLALELARAIPSYRVYAASWDDARVQDARRKIEEAGLYGTLFANGAEGKGLPFPDDSMNIVVSSADELKDEVRLKEALRILRPDGTLLFLGRNDLLKKAVAPPQTLFKLTDGADLTKVQKLRPEAAGDWAQYHCDEHGSLVSRDRLLSLPLKVQWMNYYWRELCGESYDQHRFPGAVANQHVLVINDGKRNDSAFDPGDLVALDPYNGLVLWRRRDFFPQSKMLVDKTLYLATARDILAVDALDGKERQRYALPAEVKGSVQHVILWERLFIGIATSKGQPSTVFAMEVATGKIVWTREVEAGVYRFGNRGYYGFSMCIGDGRVYGTAYGTVHKDKFWALDAATGNELWKKEYDGPGATTSLLFGEGKLFAYAFADPTVIRVLDAKDGSEFWTKPNPGLQMPVLINNVAYFLGKMGKILAFDVPARRELYHGLVSNQGWGCGPPAATVTGLIFHRYGGLGVFSTRDEVSYSYPGFCPACGGMIIANGMLYASRPGLYAFAGGGTAPAVRNAKVAITGKEDTK